MSKNSVILIVDDEEDDRLLLQLALKRAGIVNRPIALPDGQDAIDYLAGGGEYADREKYPWPALVITDFMMPRKGGMDLLNWIRGHPEMGQVPVVVMVGSASKREMEMAEQAGASAVFSKPVEFSRLVQELKAVGEKLLRGEGKMERGEDGSPRTA